MYKVFIYDKPVLIHKNPQISGSYEQLKSASNVDLIIQLLESDEVEGVEVISENPDYEWEVFKSFFKYIIAAGGTVFNSDNDLLVIYRLGKWDLPKGKLEKEEDIPTCALREVQEECGVDGLKIIKELPSTFHCYKTRKGKWAFKRTYWYTMTTDFKGVLIPQAEEGIDKALWFKKEQYSTIMANTYNSLKLVVESL